MGIIFKKNGRPTKTEKIKVKNINTFLSALEDSEKDKYAFSNEKITSVDRLNDIWESVISPKKEVVPEEKNTVVNNEHGEVDTSTGELIEEKEQIEKETTNFVTNKEEMEESAEVLIEEVNGEVTDAVEEEVPSFFNPLKEPIVKRSYQKNVQTDVGEIEEPDFGDTRSVEEKLEQIESEKTFNEEDHKFHHEEEEEEEEESEGAREWDNVTNEKMQELDKKDAELASKQLVATVLDGYEMLHEIGKNFVKYPEEKLQEKVIKGEIDPTMEIPIDERGTTTNPIEFFQSFNEQAEEAISFDPDFADKVRPAMERVFAKKGWGMTDEQFLMVAFGKDIAWKGVQIMSLKKTANGIMETFVKLQKDKNDAIRQERRAEATRPRPVSPDSIVTPPPTTKPPIQDENHNENRGYHSADADVVEDSVNTETGVELIH
jgi:hypothetical protein